MSHRRAELHRRKTHRGHHLNIVKTDPKRTWDTRDELRPLRDELIEWGREEYGPTCTWDREPEPEELDQVPESIDPGLCPNGLHAAGDTFSGECRRCRNIRRKRNRYAQNGRVLCWTAEHEAPPEGERCACGEPPPEETSADWAIVDRAIRGFPLPRRLTAREELTALRTISVSYGIGWYESASHLFGHTDLWLDEERVRYLTGGWLDRTGAKPQTVHELMHEQYNESQTAATEAAAA